MGKSDRSAVLVRALKRTSFVLLLLPLAYLLWCWSASQEEQFATVDERRQAWTAAISWLQSNEEQLLEQPNTALWWMLHHAAEVSSNPYLTGLVQRHVDLLYGQGREVHLPWRRMIEPSATVSINALPIEALLYMAPYQRDFLHATVCAPVHAPDQTTSGAFLERNLCRPNILHVVLKDKVCATHQLMALQVHRQSRCPGPQPSDGLRAELSADVRSQLFWFPWFEDADLQRVLMLYWQQGAVGVRPAWFNRVIRAQRDDGGWSGDRQIVGLPGVVQPVLFRQARQWWQGEKVTPLRSDFHASAQGVLLLALSLHADQGGVWALGDE